MGVTAENIDWSLYAILDKDVLAGRPAVGVARELVAAGVGVLQLRYKSVPSDEFYHEAIQIREIATEFGIPLIINDRVDIALAVAADGVHLGQSDLPVQAVRDLVRGKIIGSSVHNLQEFETSERQSPDYYGVGTIFTSPTKQGLEVSGLQVLRDIRPKTGKPLVAIGGITPENVGSVIAAGADGVAVISALLTVADVAAQARAFLEKINAAKQQFKRAHGT